MNSALGLRFLELAAALKKSVNAMGGERYRLATKGTVPGVDLLQEIKEAYPEVDTNWLVTGVGSMFIRKEEASPVGSRVIATLPIAVTVDRDGNENIVCVEARAKAGYVNGLGDPAYLTKLPAYRLPYLGIGTFRDFQVDGFSMFNPETGQIMPNSHVISKSISYDEIRSSRVHVVVTTNDLLIKRVYPEDGTLRLRSDNPDKIAYPDIEVRQEDIRELWYVERLITASIPPRSSTDELQELRGEMDTMRRQLHELQQKG